MSESIVELRGVSKDYESGAGVVRALREVDLSVKKGEFVAIVGASGSGKSTMMNILGCLDRPTRGTYTLSGVEVSSRSNDGRALVRNRLIGFIFQGFNLLPRTTALENCELPLQYRGFGRSVRRKRAMAALAQVGLADRVHHTPNQLSGGQQQRVAIARALVTNPPLLLADEPTGNLDTRTSLEVLALLQKLNRDDGITIALVTHEHDIAACAKRVITMRDGKIVSDVIQEKPEDAAAELLLLPPPHAGEVDEGPASLDAQEALRERLGGPVPFVVYAAMAGGSLLGALVGFLYALLVLGVKAAWVPVLGAVLAEGSIGARYGARKAGRPLTSDQRARVSIAFTCGFTAPLVAVVAWFTASKFPSAVVERFEHLSSGGVALWLLLAMVALAATALLRYLLLSLLSPKRAARRHGVAAEAP